MNPVKRVAGTCAAGPYVTLDGSTGQVSATSAARSTSPSTFSLEAWIRTSSMGGDIISFGDSQNGTSATNDRSLFVGADGRLTFGVFNGDRIAIPSKASVADGRWHHVVATLSTDGMALYVDGTLNSSLPVASTQNFSGWWRIRHDTLTFQPNAPDNEAFRGDLDDTSVYPTALTASQVSTLYARGR
jgi:hypothetical protein